MSDFNFEPTDATKAKQAAAILAALRQGPMSTLHITRELGVMHPPARVRDLRRAGWPIQTRRTTQFDAQGRPHTVALYVLLDAQGGIE